MAKITRLRFDDAADLDRWQRYILSRPDSHYSDLAQWRLLFRELYGIEDLSYVCLDGERVTGAMSLYHLRSPFVGRALLTNPFFGTGGFYWEDDDARDALLAQARVAGRELRADYVELRLRSALAEPFAANTDFADFDLELEAEPDRTWDGRLSSNVRQNIRKARKQNLEFRLSTDHRACFDLLRRTLRHHGTPFHGLRFFELLTRRLGDHVSFTEVRHGDRLVAGGVAVRFKETISTPYIGSLFDDRALRPNYLQYWGLIEHAAERGLRRFEMGRSPAGSTHARFKQKWGCAEIPLFYNHVVLDARRGYRSVSRPSRLQLLATRVWRQLPLGLTTGLGPWLARHIP